MSKLIVGLVGYPASGKGTISNYLVKKYGAVSFSLSEEIRSELKSVGFDIPSRETLQATGNILRKIYGNHILAQRTFSKVKKSKKEFVVIEGIRNTGEVDLFNKSLKKFKLVAVISNPKVRFERIPSRNRFEGIDNWQQFLISEENENKKLGVNVTMQKADYILSNEGSLKMLYNGIDKLIQGLQK